MYISNKSINPVSTVKKEKKRKKKKKRLDQDNYIDEKGRRYVHIFAPPWGFVGDYRGI